MKPESAPALPTLADALCARLNCRGIGQWLHELAEALELPLQHLMVEPPQRQHCVLVGSLGLMLVLSHPHAGNVARGDTDRWLITEAGFGLADQYGQPWVDALPFGLDGHTDTPSLAAIKLDGLGQSTGLSAVARARGDMRQTWFLDDALTLELTWQGDGVGMTHVWATRLGGELLAPRAPWLRNEVQAAQRLAPAIRVKPQA